MRPISALMICAIAGVRGDTSSCALPGTCEDVSSGAVASNSMLQVVKKSTQIQLEEPNCKLYLGLNLPQPGDPVKCHTAGTFMSDLGEQCMKQKAADGTISQRCDGAPGHAGTTEFLCSKFEAVPNTCCTAGGVQYICAADDGYLSGPEATDFDECSQTCPGYSETTTKEPVPTEETTTVAPATTTIAGYADQYCQFHVMYPSYNYDSKGDLNVCTTQGVAGQDGGFRCMKMKVNGQMVQTCDGYLNGAEMGSQCQLLQDTSGTEFAPNQCVEIQGLKVICSGDGGFPDPMKASDFDNCGVTEETTTPTTTTTTATTFPIGCEPWCREPPKPGKPESTWAQKCGWDETQQIVVPSQGWKACRKCWECDNVGQEFSDKCKDWCAEKPEPWEKKCEWKYCKKCNKCNTQKPTCPQWCGQSNLDSCKWKPCKLCKSEESSPCMKPPPCDAYCGKEDKGGWKNTCTWKGCKGCDECQKNRMMMAHTTLTVPAKAGDVVIQTEDSMGFAAGDKGFLEKGTTNEEVFVVSGFGSLVFEKPLNKSHPPGAAIDIDESQTTGSTADLNQDGYAAVAALRCARQMMEFVQRVAVNEGFDICDMGGVAGFAIWFDTPEDGKTYDALLSEIEIGVAGDCSFLVASGGVCRPLASTCPSFPGQELPECARD